MLVLTRKKHQSFDIGDNVRVTVLNVDKGHVKIGIAAPDSVKILRCELVGREKK